MTVVETPGFIRDASAALTDEERTDMISFLAANPEAGDVMAETGGGRKLRWKAQGRGKRGGVRVIYYSTMNRYRCFFSTYSLRMSRRILPGPNETR